MDVEIVKIRPETCVYFDVQQLEKTKPPEEWHQLKCNAVVYCSGVYVTKGMCGLIWYVTHMQYDPEDVHMEECPF